MDAFRMCNILKFTENNLVLIPHLLTVFCIYHGRKFNTVDLLNRAIITELQEVSQRFIDSSFNEWCRSLECFVKNDGGQTSQSCLKNGIY